MANIWRLVASSCRYRWGRLASALHSSSTSDMFTARLDGRLPTKLRNSSVGAGTHQFSEGNQPAGEREVSRKTEDEAPDLLGFGGGGGVGGVAALLWL